MPPKKTARKSSGLSWKRIKSLAIFTFRHYRFLRAMRALARAKTPLVLANLELGKKGYSDPEYPHRVREFNQAMVELTKAKWYVTRGSRTRAREDWKQAAESFKRSMRLGEDIHQALVRGDRAPILHERSLLDAKGSEILFADGVPLVPEINPVVILKGSDYDMGYQYARQLVQIFGPWILEQKVGRNFTGEELAILKQWEAQMRVHTPEILGMIAGWADGAADAGVPMSYEDVLEIWTGHLPPAKSYLRLEDGAPEIPPPMLCSGAAAWGRSTVDGRLVAGSSGDHDATYMVTVIAFPDAGNNFIVSPFGATGDVPFVGQTHMFGHPGMNNKGLAYVHHGGVARMVEPKKHWGYGVRRGASIWHILRFAGSALEARQIEMSFPVGDVGMDSVGTVGGFYADSSYGYVLESRKDPVALREAGLLNETDFLYANNSALHPESGKAGWMQGDGREWRWDEHGGWYTSSWVPFSRARSIAERMGFMYWGSRRRNEYLSDMLRRGLGKIDLEYMKMIYRQSGTLPPGSWAEISEQYNKTGGWGAVSTGNTSNALVGVMKPEHGDGGLYSLCVGAARRGVTPNASVWVGFNPIHAETNAFYELRLASSPEGVTAYARQKAVEFISSAQAELKKLDERDCAYEPLASLVDRARADLEKGEVHESAARSGSVEAIYAWSRATRAYTRAQVRARQVINARIPPPASPEALGLVRKPVTETPAPA